MYIFAVDTTHVWYSLSGLNAEASNMSFRHKLHRSEPLTLRTVHGDKNVIRGHALFVRFMDRWELQDCIHYFPEDMTLGNLRAATPRELVSRYSIQNAKDRERILKVIEDARKEDISDTEVGLKIKQATLHGSVVDLG